MKTTHLIIGGLGVAAVAGFALTRPPAAEPVSHSTPVAEPSSQANEGRPPGHPPMEGMPPGHPPTGNMPPGHPGPDSTGMPPGHPPVGADAAALPPGKFADDESLAWKMPAKWKEIPSPSSMRIATYRLPGSDEAECSVVRAGGTPDANIDRWIGQFGEGGETAKRSKTTVNGMTVSRLDVQGTFNSGGMGGGSPAAKKGWAMTGLVVETPAGSYFFKITGPEAAVKGAAKDVDALIASLAPVK